MWTGNDGKTSKRSILAIVTAIDFWRNMHHIVYRWDVGKSFVDIAPVLGIEASLLITLIGIKAYQNIQFDKLHKDLPQEEEK